MGMEMISVSINGTYRNISDDGTAIEFTDEFGNSIVGVRLNYQSDTVTILVNGIVREFAHVDYFDDMDLQFVAEFPNLQLRNSIILAQRNNREFNFGRWNS